MLEEAGVTRRQLASLRERHGTAASLSALGPLGLEKAHEKRLRVAAHGALMPQPCRASAIDGRDFLLCAPVLRVSQGLHATVALEGHRPEPRKEASC
jgi:hypothetical protein